MGYERFDAFGFELLDFAFSFFNADAKIGVLLNMKSY